ncbi:MAG TPA: hypothetical protein PLF32_01265 [Bacteroidales bacterium]|nr:hypothetical protein [Bacteroidales bacterium]HOR81269.1 hypothetical protein [Bacteroidales bacterium]HPJ90536.1 hypothetical protein [Bacteroidales bacterium]
MTLAKKFLHKQLNFIQISQSKIIIGILLGLFFAFTFYSFLYLVRETFRVLSLTETYDLWILTDKEVRFYNLIFAFISVIIGQAVAFSIWFDRPKSIFEKRNYIKTTILNDQRALNLYFLCWFSKLSIIFGLIFGLTIPGGFYVVSLYPDYNFVFILIIIVLFLQTWNTMNLSFKRKGQKWMLISAVLLSIIAFGFSKINLIDYKAINQKLLQKNIHYSYNLELPETESYEKLSEFLSIKNIYIVETKTQQANAEAVIIVDNKKIMNWQSLRSEYDVHRMIYRLHIHKSIKMDFVNQVKKDLSKLGISKIAYAVIPTNREYNEKYYQDCSFPIILPNWNTDSLNLITIYKDLNKIPNIIEVKQIESDYLINDSLVKKNQIKTLIKNLIRQNPNYIIKYHVNDNIVFSDYFKVLTSSKEAIDDLRNEYSEKKYSKQYDLLDYEEVIEVKQKFPFYVFEITTDLKKRIEIE